MQRLSAKYLSSPALRFEPVLSAGLCILALTLAVASAASVLLSAIPSWLGVPLCVLACWGIVSDISRLHRFCGDQRVRALVYERGDWSLQLYSGTYCPLELASSPLQCGLVMAADFRRRDCDPGAYRLFLLRDMVDVESWRRVSLALRQEREIVSG